MTLEALVLNHLPLKKKKNVFSYLKWRIRFSISIPIRITISFFVLARAVGYSCDATNSPYPIDAFSPPSFWIEMSILCNITLSSAICRNSSMFLEQKASTSLQPLFRYWGTCVTIVYPLYIWLLCTHDISSFSFRWLIIIVKQSPDKITFLILILLWERWVGGMAIVVMATSNSEFICFDEVRPQNYKQLYQSIQL